LELRPRLFSRYLTNGSIECVDLPLVDVQLDRHDLT